MTSQPKLECLQNQTVPKVFPQGRQSICGNGILEPPEQCDCGAKEVSEKDWYLVLCLSRNLTNVDVT